MLGAGTRVTSIHPRDLYGLRGTLHYRAIVTDTLLFGPKGHMPHKASAEYFSNVGKGIGVNV